MATEAEARAVKQRHSLELLRQPGVCGVGVERDANGEFFIALHLDNSDPKMQEQLPKELEGIEVKQLHSGPFRPLSS
jgi:hypothetical protein